MSQQKAQFMPQLAMWQVVISKWIMMGSYKDTPPPTKTYHMGELWYKLCLITPPPITTHHIASCGTNYAFCDGTKLSHFFFGLVWCQFPYFKVTCCKSNEPFPFLFFFGCIPSFFIKVRVVRDILFKHTSHPSTSYHQFFFKWTYILDPHKLVQNFYILL